MRPHGSNALMVLWGLCLSVGLSSVLADVPAASSAPAVTTAQQTAITSTATTMPDSLAALEAHPEFVKLVKITGLRNGSVMFQAVLCRKKGAPCDMLRSDRGAQVETSFADYVYLFAVYKSKFDDKSPPGTGLGAHDAAQSFLDQAKSNEAGQAILDHYNQKYPCADSKDDVKCVMHSIWKAAGMHRSYYRVADYGNYSIQDADENGETLFTF